MNHKMVFSTLGKIMQIEAILLMLPFAVAVLYGENNNYAFIISILTALIGGIILGIIFKPKDKVIYAKDGFVIVALSWFVLSLVGALPFYLSKEIPNYCDAFFETVSGFTTTGASILTDVPALSKSMLFWRSFTHWIGGMGIIVLVMAIFSTDSGRSMHIMRAEMPGPIVGKLVPRVKETAKLLYIIYIGLTLIEVIFLWLGDMDLYESFVFSFGTAGTGGFSIKADGLASYSSYSQWVITVFMLLFGVNFNLYYLTLIGKIKNVFKSEELRAYIGIVILAISVVFINTFNMFSNALEGLKHSSFQVASIITTTGYATTDFNLWPNLSKMVLLLLMFVGGCAGSTAGGMKVSRIFFMFKIICNNIKRLIHPRAVSTLMFEGKAVDDETQKSVSCYFGVYFFIMAGFLFLLNLEPFDFETNFTAVVSCYNNVGPGLSLVGPMGNYSGYSDFSTCLLSLAMLFGRLEIYPILVALLPNTWLKKR